MGVTSGTLDFQRMRSRCVGLCVRMSAWSEALDLIKGKPEKQLVVALKQ